MWIEQAVINKSHLSEVLYQCNSFIHLASDFVTHKGFWGPLGGQTSVKTVVDGGEHPIPSYEQVNRVLAANKPSKVSILVSLKAVIFLFPA